MHAIKTKKIKFFNFESILLLFLFLSLISHYTKIIPVSVDIWILIIMAGLASVPVIFSSIRSLVVDKKFSIDLLAGITLIFALLNKEWSSAVFINLMLTSARLFWDYTNNRARRGIESLIKMRPQRAKIKKNGKILGVKIEELKEGDLVVVESGESIPIDGVVVEGDANVNQSSLTGESLPIFKKKGDKVFSSTIIVSGNMVIKTEKVGEETAFEKIIELVEQSQINKSRTYSLIEKFTNWYIVLILIASIFVYFISKNVNLVLAMMLVVCADDIAIAIPLAFAAAIGLEAKRGVIIKGGTYLEYMAKVKKIVVDKTGTLTKGNLKVVQAQAFAGKKREDLLFFGSMATILSDHASSKAIVDFVKKEGVEIKEPDDIKEFNGRGAIAHYQGKGIISGKLSFMKEEGVELKDSEISEILNAEGSGHSLTLTACDGKLLGYFALSDEVRSGIKDDILRLKKMGIEKIIMLTGDNERIADQIAKEVGITEFHASLFPEDKIAYLKQYLNKGYKVAMIGDGLNDAAALALSDVGIAMGSIGFDATIESADIVLMKDDFSKIPELVTLGLFILKIAKQDIIIWALLNIIGLSLVFTGVFGPTQAAAFNFLSDFIPLINSIRVFRWYFKDSTIVLNKK